MRSCLSPILRRTRGASMVEYALLLFAVLIVAAASVKFLGKRVRKGGDMATEQLMT